VRPPISYLRTGDGPAVLLLRGLGGDHNQCLGLLPDTIHATGIAPDMPLRSWIPNARLVTVPRKVPDPTEHSRAVQEAVAVDLALARCERAEH
jgi:hypothetical protein